MPTISKLPNGKFKAIIKAKGRFLKCKTFTRLTDARIWAKRIEADHEAMIALGSAGASMTLSDLADRYMKQWDAKDKSQGARVQWWVNRFGRRKLIDIESGDVRDALTEYGAGKAHRGDGIDPKTMRTRTKETKRTRAPGTVNRMRATLSALYRYGQKQGLVTVNPVKHVVQAAENNKRVRWLSRDERTALLEACRASSCRRLYLLALMALMTGARQGELLKLRWSDIDFRAKTAMARDTKNGSDRVLTLPDPTIPELMKFREVGNCLVFPSELTPNRPMEFRKHWNQAVSDAGITDFRFHDLRHSAASYLVMAGATLFETGEILGHRSIVTTQRYAHLSTEHKAALTNRVLGGLLSPD